MAQLRDYFAQRDGEANDTEIDQSPPEAKQAEQEENPVDKDWKMQSFSETSSNSEGFQYVYESLEACSKPLADVLNDTSQAHNYTSNSEPEKSESNSLADSATLTGGESAIDTPDKPLHSNEEPTSAELNESVSEAEEKILKHGMIYECTSNIESEPADSVISVMSSGSLVSPTSSFTFGTVVAPLYHQVFGRVGSENQSVGNRGNPVRAIQSVRDLTQSYHQAENIESNCTFTRDDGGYNDRVQEYVIEVQESNQECLDAALNSPPTEEEEKETSVTPNDILDHADTPDETIHSDQGCTNPNEVPQLIIGATETHPHTGNILNALITKESSYPQGEAQEDNMTYDLQTQTIAETAQVLLPEHSCPQIKTKLDTSLAQTETQEVSRCQETSFLPHQPSSFSKSECVCDETDQHTSSSGENVSGGETNTGKGIGKTVTISIASAISEENKLLKALYDLNPNPSDNSVARENENSSISCCEIVDENDFTTHDTSLESQEETDNVEKQNKHLSADEVEKDQLEDTDLETVFKNRDAKERDKEEADEELVEEQATRENDNKDADVLGDKQSFGEEEIRDMVTGIEIQCVEKDSIAGEDKTVEETEMEKREEEEGNEEHFVELQNINVDKINVQKEEELEAETEMEIYLKSEDKTGVEWEVHVKAREQNLEHKNWDCKEEVLVETGEEETVDAKSEDMTLEGTEDEVGCSYERQDITRNEAEDGLSALVSNLQSKGKENTGEEQHAHIPAEIHFYKEEDFHSNKNVTHDRSKAGNESAAAEGCLCILTDDPKSDQSSHDSASAESDSDDEVELYMHCLRAVHTGTQAEKDRNKDTGFAVSKRASVSRSKNLSTPMPSISESLDEEQQLQDNNEDMEKIGVQPTATALSGGQERITRHVSWWKETFSCSNISKTLLYATSLVVFLVVAYHYDFLACFVLYLVSVVWLCCQEETQPAKNNNRIG